MPKQHRLPEEELKNEPLRQQPETTSDFPTAGEGEAHIAPAVRRGVEIAPDLENPTQDIVEILENKEEQAVSEASSEYVSEDQPLGIKPQSRRRHQKPVARP